MTSIYVFCVQDNLQEWIAELCTSAHLGIICFGRGDFGEVVTPDLLNLKDDIYQVFLFPNGAPPPRNLSMNSVRQREWGWINIRPGGVRVVGPATILLLSEVHGEKYGPDSAEPERRVQWLKRTLKPRTYQGVIGTNIETGGTSIYKDISYTLEARRLFDSGVVWKQFPTDNSVFEPLETQGQPKRDVTA